MKTENLVYTYEILKKQDTELIKKTAECLAGTFTGVQVGDLWIQEPIIGYALQLPYDDFYAFTKEYIEENVEQGYCAVALDEAHNVVGALVGDANAFVIGESPQFEGSFSNMNVLIDVLEDIDERFLQDYKARFGKDLEDGEVLHLFLLGVSAQHDRHQVVQQLGNMLRDKAKEKGIKMMLAEATNPKSIRLFERFHGLTKYVTVEGEYIAHLYENSKHLGMIPDTMADGIYIIAKEL
ncbi:MAG: GNAT family N-acetyltransferase [Solibacillus sp.]